MLHTFDSVSLDLSPLHTHVQKSGLHTLSSLPKPTLFLTSKRFTNSFNATTHNTTICLANYVKMTYS